MCCATWRIRDCGLCGTRWCGLSGLVSSLNRLIDGIRQHLDLPAKSLKPDHGGTSALGKLSDCISRADCHTPVAADASGRIYVRFSVLYGYRPTGAHLSAPFTSGT
jgi:hypothetical protein